MKKLADISSFESLGVSNAVSDVSVFNKLYKYDDEMAVPGYLLSYIINDDDSGISKQDKKWWDIEEKRILEDTGGRWVIVCPNEDENGEFISAYGGWNDDVECTIMVEYDGDDVPDWAILPKIDDDEDFE